MLYQRQQEYFQERINEGRIRYSDEGLLPGELDSVYGRDAKSNDGLSPHHMPSSHSINNELGICGKDGSCLNMMTDTHVNTFTYGMNSSTREGDLKLYESLSYEDRLLFDQHDTMIDYALTRENVDLDIVERRLEKQYEDSMKVQSEAIQKENSEEMKQEGCS